MPFVLVLFSRSEFVGPEKIDNLTTLLYSGVELNPAAQEGIGIQAQV